MSAAETIARVLKAKGWRVEPIEAGRPIDARLSYARPDAYVELDHRPQRGELWLWLFSADDKRCLGLKYGANLEQVLAKVVALQDSLSMDDYFGAYSELGSVCEASIMAWEQFEAGPSVEEAEHKRRLAAASGAAQAVASGSAGEADPELFPGQPVSRLSDYVAIMKRMQRGDMMGVLAEHKLDIMKWGSVAAAWGQKMAADPVLTAKFTKLLQG